MISRPDSNRLLKTLRKDFRLNPKNTFMTGIYPEKLLQ
jgi:hypothetical protein